MDNDVIARIERHDYRDPLGHPLVNDVDWLAITQADKARGEWPRDWRAAIRHAIELVETEREWRELDGAHRARFTRSATVLNAMLVTTPQPQGDGFTAADMMDARAEERARLSTPQARPDGGEVIRWPNWCDTSVPEALRYLSKNERPKGGCERFNAEHLLQLANEIELMAKKLREAHPAPAPNAANGVPITPIAGDVARLVEAAKIGARILRWLEMTRPLNKTEVIMSSQISEALAPFTTAQPRKATNGQE